MFNIGDKVVVLGSRDQYTSYGEWAEVMGLSCFKAGALLKGGEECEVVCRGFHSICPNRLLYGIKDSNGDGYIIGGDSLKKAPKKVRLDLEIVAGTGVRVREYQPYQLNDTWPISTIEVNLETGEVVQIKE